jgi:hypothetical protein
MRPRVFTGSRLFVALLVGCALLMAACGGSANAGASTKPLTASEILQRSQSSAMKDATFDATLTLTASGTIITFTGTGKLMKSPPRSELILHGTFFGVTKTIDTITDGNTSYTKTTPSTSTKWVKTTGSGSALPGGGSSITNYGDLQNPTLIGTETLNGYQVYHLSGKLVAPTSTVGSTATPTTEDLWARTDNYYPAKVAINSVTALSGTPATVNVVLAFTSWDTGLTIALPPPGDVVNG